MNSKLMECFMNPKMCRLYIEISEKGEMTARQLSAGHPDIPQTTLYRYLKRMVNDRVIVIAREKRVRGTIEKTYAVSDKFEQEIENIVENNLKESYMMLFMQYLLSLVNSFQKYCKQEYIDIKKDISGFNAAPVYATNEEMEKAIAKMMAVVTELRDNVPSEGRRLRNIGMIITPPDDEK